MTSWFRAALASLRDHRKAVDLVVELKAKQTRAAQIQAEMAASQRAPDTLRRALDGAEPYVRARLDQLKNLIIGRSEDARRGWKAIFPEGMTFSPVTVGRRHVWRARANARFGAISQSTLDGDPSGIRNRSPGSIRKPKRNAILSCIHLKRLGFVAPAASRTVPSGSAPWCALMAP
jgi:hypothetical protein